MSSSGSSSSTAGSSASSFSPNEVFNVTDLDEDHQPKKSRTIDSNEDFYLSQPSTSTIRCFMCSFAHIEARIVEQHMNTVHFDLTDSSAEAAVQMEPAFSCPMCPNSFSDAETLQSHVNKKHKDILSPSKVPPNSNKAEPANVCPVCNISSKSPEDLIAHVDTHFSHQDRPDSNEAPNTNYDRLIAEQISKSIQEKENQEQAREFELFKERYGMNDRGDFKEQSTINLQKAVRSGRLTLVDYYEKHRELKVAEYRGIDDGSSRVRDVISRIREKSKNSANVAESHICYTADFYGSSFGDRGWGCGYRNIQMLLSALSRNKIYAELLKKHIYSPHFGIQKFTTNVMPSIPKIQEMIEWAWKEGFDVQGRDQLDGKLYNTKKWIGATEVTALLSSMRIKCELIDTMRPTVAKLHYRMFDWIVSYFKKKDTFKPPLYLQHDGHSRTIIGVEILKDSEVTLLILDPGIDSDKIENMLKLSNPYSTLKLLRKSLSNLACEQYQIVSVCGVFNSEDEYEASKILQSTKVQ